MYSNYALWEWTCKPNTARFQRSELNCRYFNLVGMAEEYRPNKHGCLKCFGLFYREEVSVCESIRSPFLKQFFLWQSLFQLMNWSHIWHMYIIYIHIHNTYIYTYIIYIYLISMFEPYPFYILYIGFMVCFSVFFGHTQREVLTRQMSTVGTGSSWIRSLHVCLTTTGASMRPCHGCGCVWKWLVPHCTQWFCWSLSRF